MEIVFGEAMTQFIATFFSQYGAVQFSKKAKQNNIACTLAPVPRALSSSCGTCAFYTSDDWDPGFAMQDLEIVYQATSDGYTVVHAAEDI